MTDRERFYVLLRPTDGAHATSWLVKDRQAKWYASVSQHRSEKAAVAKAAKLNKAEGLTPNEP